MKQASKPTSGGGWGFWVGWALAFLGLPLGGLATWTLLGPIATPLNGAIGAH
jgi:hypothetical protein